MEKKYAYERIEERRFETETLNEYKLTIRSNYSKNLRFFLKKNFK
jgi:hypothetical protein